MVVVVRYTVIIKTVLFVVFLVSVALQKNILKYHLQSGLNLFLSTQDFSNILSNLTGFFIYLQCQRVSIP